MASPYVGSRISLISKSQIRYEGVLSSIDQTTSQVQLENVQSFGTEGRRLDGPEIPASDRVYQYILFRSADIAQLHVLQPPSGGQQPPPQQPFVDPAIVQAQPVQAPIRQEQPKPAVQASAPTQKQWGAPPGAATSHAPAAATLHAPGAATLHAAAPKPAVDADSSRQRRNPRRRGRGAGESGGGRGGGNARGGAAAAGGRGPRGGPSNEPNPVPIPDGEFDYEEANAKFEKEATEVEDRKPEFDDELGFFDSISSEVSSKIAGERSGGPEERKKLASRNVETFGKARAHHHPRRRNNYHHRPHQPPQKLQQ